MKKFYKMQDLDCANCAAKMENAISKIDGVNSVSINFMMQKIALDVEDGKLESVLEQAQKAVAKVDRECKILVK